MLDASIELHEDNSGGLYFVDRSRSAAIHINSSPGPFAADAEGWLAGRWGEDTCDPEDELVYRPDLGAEDVTDWEDTWRTSSGLLIALDEADHIATYADGAVTLEGFQRAGGEGCRYLGADAPAE